MAELIRGLRPERVRENLDRVRSEIARAGRDPSQVEILAAVKYVALEELGVLAEAGIALVGENRAQDLVAKAEAYPGRFTWDFIGQLQSRKVRQLVPYVRYIESVASDSALAQLGRYGNAGSRGAGRGQRRRGAEQERRRADRARGVHRPLPGQGRRADDDAAVHRRRRRRAARISRRSGSSPSSTSCAQLSMGTSQDYLVAVQEGATIVRLGTSLYS